MTLQFAGYEEGKCLEEEDIPAPVGEEATPGDQPKSGIPQGYSLFILSPTNPFRVMCYNFINHGVISNFILVCILISSASLAMEDPLDSKSRRNQILGYFDYFFTTVFTFEIFIKVVSYGAFQKGGYCREPPNMLDIVVVSVSIVSIVFSDSAGAVSVLKGGHIIIFVIK